MNEEKGYSLYSQLIYDLEDLGDGNDFTKFWWERYRELKVTNPEFAKRAARIAYKYKEKLKDELDNMILSRIFERQTKESRFDMFGNITAILIENKTEGEDERYEP